MSQLTLRDYEGRLKTCASARDIEICAVLQPKEGEEMGLEIVEGCGYCNENGHCHYPNREKNEGVIN